MIFKHEIVSHFCVKEFVWSKRRFPALPQRISVHCEYGYKFSFLYVDFTNPEQLRKIKTIVSVVQLGKERERESWDWHRPSVVSVSPDGCEGKTLSNCTPLISLSGASDRPHKPPKRRELFWLEINLWHELPGFFLWALPSIYKIN